MGSNGKNSKTGVAVAAITESCSRNRRKLKKDTKINRATERGLEEGK